MIPNHEPRTPNARVTLMRWREHWSTKLLALSLTATVAAAYIVWPTRAEASHLGSSTASAGNAFLPVQQSIQAFQPDLFTGRAATAVPIVVPPGRKGMQPSLAVSYASSNRNGWVGVGWTLELGAIERSTKNGPPHYDATDTFVFNFQGVQSELVQIPDGSYRAKDEGLFLKFTFDGTRWTVRDKLGTTYFFGSTLNSELATLNGTFRWCLDTVIDTNGNYLEVTYTADQGMLYPAEIRYTGHEPTSAAPAHRVVFTLEDRPDVETNFRSGAPLVIAKRLKEIAAYANTSQLARKYVLAYTTSPRTNRSLLTGVTPFGTDGVTTLPPQTFTYQEDALGYLQCACGSPPQNHPHWNLRTAAIDLGHDNFGALNPYAGLPWSAPIADQSGDGSSNGGNVRWSIGGDGSLQLRGNQDHHVHAWTYVYVSSGKSVGLSLNKIDCDSNASLWVEDGSGLRQVTPGSFSVNAGWSILHVTDYHQHDCFSSQLSGPVSQVESMNASLFTEPQLAGDVTGDGITDLMVFTPGGGTWDVAVGNRLGFLPKTTWLSGVGNASDTPLLGDIDGDGKTDLALFNGGSWRLAKSTGTSWQVDAWSSVTTDAGTPLIGDFNGDGLADLGVVTSSGAWMIRLNTGNGTFQPAVAWLNGWGAGQKVIGGDFNGDGLTDVGYVDGSQRVFVALSTGQSFQAQASAWSTSFPGQATVTSGDLNGDGLTDLAYLSGSTVMASLSTGAALGAPTALFTGFTLSGSAVNLQLADYNGDGIAEAGVFSTATGESQLSFSIFRQPDLLSTVSNGVGGTTTLTYTSSAAFDNTGEEDDTPDLPFVTPVVTQVDVSDGQGHTYTTRYTYRGGRYDAPTREFRGFAQVEVRDAANTVTATTFAQDACRKGRALSQEVRDVDGHVFSRQLSTWICSEPYTGVHFAPLTQQDAFLFDGDSTFKQTRARFEYDAFGNVTRAVSDGDVAVTGDERTTETDYAVNVAAWILSAPSATRTRDAAGTLVAQRRFSYDGATSSTMPPTMGRLTQEEEWRNLPTVQWPATRMTYDPYGNVATVTDALNHTTTNTYDDATHTYLVTIKNALTHTRQMTYDARLGVVTASTDPNSQTTRTVYDALGRVLRVIGPLDTDALPTVSYAYDLATTPTRTITHTRIISGQAATLDVYAFADGLGRTLQTRAPAEDPAKHVVTGDVVFDARGLVSAAYLPYLAAAATNYQPPATSFTTVTYAYDAVGRLTSVTDPDSSVSRTQYDDWTATAIDAKGHQKRQTSDAYGRLVTVEEFNGAETYTTRYAYDALDHLTSVTDHAGNVTRLVYDSLGRKLAMDDPDMGHWTYAYDAVDNLSAQTDARGVVTSFTYDAINRLRFKTYAVPTASGIPAPPKVTYIYDATTKPYSAGRLTAITDGSGTSSFTYDPLGRLTREVKTVDAIGYTVQRAYDLLGRLTRLIYPDGELVTYTYNAQGGIETVTTKPSGAATATPIINDVTYNAAGQLTKIVYGNGVISDYTYDPQTLRLSELSTLNSQQEILQHFSYAFDAVGNVQQITDAVHAGTQSFLYDDLNRLTQASGSYGVEPYRYDAVGNMIAKGAKTMQHGLPDGTKPHALTQATSNQQPAASFTYDANGNMLQHLRSDGLPEARYTFDAENRLTQVERPKSSTVTVRFRPGWNFLTLPVMPASASISALFPRFTSDFEQVARRTATGFEHYVGQTKFDDFTTLESGRGYEIYCKNPSGVDVTFTGILPTSTTAQTLAAGWRLLGAPADQPRTVAALLTNLTVGGDVGRVLRYDQTAQQLVALSQSDQVQPGEAVYVECLRAVTWTPPADPRGVTSFVYDGDGGRVKQVTAGGTTVYLGELMERTGAITTKHIFAGALRIASKVQNSALSTLNFYHGDHLGSSNVVTDGSGQLVNVTEYTPYGELAPNSELSTLNFGFTGQRFDNSTGLYFYHARYYDPTLGCFLSPDPFVQDPSDPQFLNRYAYARNNPVKFVDPSGLTTIGNGLIYAGLSTIYYGAFVAEGGGLLIVAGAILIAAGFLVNFFGGGRKSDRPANFQQLIGDTGQRFWQASPSPLAGNFQQPLRPEYPGLGTGQGGISVGDLLATAEYMQYEHGLSVTAALVEARQAIQPAAGGRTASVLAGNLMTRAATATANTTFRMLANEPDLDFDTARLLRGVTGSGDFRRMGGPLGIGMGVLATSLRVNQIVNNSQLTFDQRGKVSGVAIFGSGLSLVAGVGVGGFVSGVAGPITGAAAGVLAGAGVSTVYSRGVVDPLTEHFIRQNRRQGLTP